MNDETPLPAQSPLLRPIVQAAIQLPDISSAAIFVVGKGTADLELGAAAGVDGPPLQRLVGAVRDPAHPIARTASDGVATFDVTPVAPTGPALRSHLPLVVERGGAQVVVGVLAVAHDHILDAAARESLTELAVQAAAVINSD